MDPVGESELAHVAQVAHQETSSVAAEGCCHLCREDMSENDKDRFWAERKLCETLILWAKMVRLTKTYRE